MAVAHPIPTDPRFKDRTGDAYGDWTVLSYAGMRSKNPYWNCRCACGVERTISGCHLPKSGGCGCAAGRSKHGHTSGGRTAEYTAWRGMIARCYSKDATDFAVYGGRGIRVCDEWRHSFERFLRDLGSRPSPEHSVDRYPDTSGNYEPTNCRWATMAEQCRNKRNNRLLTWNGKTQCVVEWSAELGIHFGTIYSRLRNGWSVEKALTTPVRDRGR